MIIVYAPSGLAHRGVTDANGKVVGTACRTTRLPKDASIDRNNPNPPNCHRCHGSSVIR